ncbi:hypothetical protein BDN72DRAFT_747421, partial [Pluteus cervinus]
TMFEAWKDDIRRLGKRKHHPFEDLDEWGVARWLIRNVSQSATDEYLKLPSVQKHGHLSFHNKYSFMKKIDQLPTGPEWTCEVVQVTGDQPGPTGLTMTEDLELWRRDPVECIQEIVGNPLFKDDFAYEPERVYQNTEATIRMVDE